MNVFYASAASANLSSMPGSRIWEINLLETLKGMGVTIFTPSYDVEDQYRDSYRHFRSADSSELDRVRSDYGRRFVDDVRAVHKSHGLDLVFTYFSSRHLHAAAIEQVKALGVPTVNFYCNAIHQFHLVEEIAPHFDYCMFPEREALPKYLAAGANPVHIQMAANPHFYKPYPLRQEFEATFVGQQYLNRGAYLRYLHDNGVDVRVWGAGWTRQGRGQQASSAPGYTTRARAVLARILGRWPRGDSHRDLPRARCGPPLSDEELIKMYSRSHISLGFSEVEDRLTGEIKRHIRLRDFEAPMSGALYLTGLQDELAEYYDMGKEILCYDTPEELLDKVQYYLAHESEAARVREAGLARARRDHTWENRFRQLFDTIGL